MKEEYRFKFDSGWHIDILLEADDLADAKRRFKKRYKREFNGIIEKI